MEEYRYKSSVRPSVRMSVELSQSIRNCRCRYCYYMLINVDVFIYLAMNSSTRPVRYLRVAGSWYTFLVNRASGFAAILWFQFTNAD